MMALGPGKYILSFFCALALGVAMPVSGLAASYGAGIENSQWYLAESIFECSLVHQVPGYGKAVFQRRAGEKLSFYLESESPMMRPGRGQLVVEAPAWRPGVAPKSVGAVDISEGNRPVRLDDRQSMMLVQGLLKGMQPTVTRASWYDNNPIRVQVSSINFSGQFQQYHACTANLLPVNYDQVRRTRILFNSGSVKLSASDRKLLDNIVTYALADSTVERIFVDGHSDRSGSRITNRALSEDRANIVADYMKAHGVPEDLVIVRAHGDQYPVSGRPSDNRRTTIRLQRQGEKPELQQASGYGGGSAG